MWKIMTTKDSKRYSTIADYNNKEDAEHFQKTNPDSVCLIIPSDKNVELLKQMLSNYELALIHTNKENISTYQYTDDNDSNRFYDIYEKSMEELTKTMYLKRHKTDNRICIDNELITIFDETPVIKAIMQIQKLILQSLAYANTLKYKNTYNINKEKRQNVLTASKEECELARRADLNLDINDALTKTEWLETSLDTSIMDNKRKFYKPYSCENEKITERILANQRLILRYIYIQQTNNSYFYRDLYTAIYESPMPKNTTETLQMLVNQQNRVLNELY